MLNFCTLSKNQLKVAKDILKELDHQLFLPAYVADIVLNRDLLTQQMLCRWLGFYDNVSQAVRQTIRPHSSLLN